MKLKGDKKLPKTYLNSNLTLEAMERRKADFVKRLRKIAKELNEFAEVFEAVVLEDEDVERINKHV